MPLLNLPIPETRDNVSRPAVFAVLRHLTGLIDISDKTPVQFAGNQLEIQQIGSAVDQNPRSWARLPYSDLLMIYVEEKSVDTDIYARHVLTPDERYIFQDEDLNIYLRPVYDSTEMTITIRVRVPSWTQAEEVKNKLIAQLSAGLGPVEIPIDYHYIVPQAHQLMLYEFWKIRELVDPLNETCPAWFKRSFTPHLTAVANQAGKHTTLAIRETQLGNLAVMESATIGEAKEQLREGGGYQQDIIFTYRFQKPIECVLSYPLVIHNQLIPEKYYKTHFEAGWREHLGAAGADRTAMANISEPPTPYDGQMGIRIPDYDDWVPYTDVNKTMPVLRFMMQVDLDNRTDLLDLNDFPDYTLTPETIAYLTASRKGSREQGICALTFTLFRKYFPMDKRSVILNEDLTLSSSADMNPRLNWHFVIGYNTDPFNMDDTAKRILSKHGTFFRQYIKGLIPNIDGTVYWPDLNGNDSIEWTAFNKTCEYISNIFGVEKLGQFKSRNLVGSYNIVARRY